MHVLTERSKTLSVNHICIEERREGWTDLKFVVNIQITTTLAKSILKKFKYAYIGSCV